MSGVPRGWDAAGGVSVLHCRSRRGRFHGFGFTRSLLLKPSIPTAMALMSASDNFALLDPTAELTSPTAPVFWGKEYEYLSASLLMYYPPPCLHHMECEIAWSFVG